MVKLNIVGEDEEVIYSTLMQQNKALREELAWLKENGPLVKAECRRLVRESDQEKKNLLADITRIEIKELQSECSSLVEEIGKLKLEQVEISGLSSLQTPESESLGELLDHVSRLERELHEANEQLKKLEK